MSAKIYYFTKTCITVFFWTFTLLGVVGFLPSDIQSQINPNPLVSPTVAEAMFGQSITPALLASDSSSSAAVLSANDSSDNQSQYAPIKYTPSGIKEYPVHISIPKIGVSAAVSNPESLADSVLDSALLTGAVRYPTSGALNDGTNVLLFGHSSYLKLIHNQAYKTFDGIQNLQIGDQIEVDSPDNAYIYVVASVQMLKDSDATVNIGGNGHELILSTCDVFGKKEDRYMVTATFTGSYPLATIQ
jgi:LPXTG-site transpeptidase (sortase) family protein